VMQRTAQERGWKRLTTWACAGKFENTNLPRRRSGLSRGCACGWGWPEWQTN